MDRIKKYPWVGKFQRSLTMPQYLKKIAEEEGTFIPVATFTDENDAAVVPDSATWSLMQSDGTIINSREDVPISSPASANDIVLSGDDLAIQAGETAQYVERRVIAKGICDSDAGNNLPYRAECVFMLENSVGES